MSVINNYHMHVNKRMRRNRVFSLVAGAITVVISMASLVLFFLEDDAFFLFETGFLLIAGLFLLWWGYAGIAWQSLRATRKQLPQQIGRLIDYVITEDGIHSLVVDTGNSSSIRWPSIGQIDDQEGYYIAAIENAYLILDKNGFSGDGRAAFERFADQFIGRHTSDTTTG